jgi:hypothetical protein
MYIYKICVMSNCILQFSSVCTAEINVGSKLLNDFRVSMVIMKLFHRNLRYFTEKQGIDCILFLALIKCSSYFEEKK